jgi:hypothetical protein
MAILAYHRTSIGDGRSIVKHGFEDREWDFGLTEPETGEPRTLKGVWLSDRPLEHEEGVAGDAQLEVTLYLSEEELRPYRIEGVVWDSRLWVVPADFVNSNSSVRILHVDPRTSWWHEVQEDEPTAEDEPSSEEEGADD